MKKPTKEYLELMSLLEQNAINEAKKASDKAVNKKSEELKLKDYLSTLSERKDKEEKVAKKKKKRGLFKESVKGDIIAQVLEAIIIKSLPDESSSSLIYPVIREFVEKQEPSRLLSSMRTKTQLLSELACHITEAYDEEVEDLDEDNLEVDDTPAISLISMIKSDEDLDEISNMIKEKVSRATNDFIAKNMEMKMDIKDTLMKAQRKIETTKTGDEELDEEIKEYTISEAKKKTALLKEAGSNMKTIYEQLVYNLSKSIITSDMKKEFLKENKLDMDKISSRATAIYTVLEAINTLKLVEIDKDIVNEFITFE